jgi:low temperature requirement protein LtrA
MSQREQRVTPLELFFDLVFVFALTQVTLLMSDDPTWGGIARGLLVLAALWWAWTGYAWLTNALEPEEGLVRAGMFAAMAAMLLVALTVPEAFDSNAVLFGVAYLLVRVLHLLLYAIAGKRDPDLLGAVLRFTPSALLAPAIILVAAFLDGVPQGVLWALALGLDYLGALRGRGQGWRVHPAHFAERHGLVVIIALGESIVSIGIGAAGVPLTPGIVAASVLGIVIVSALWWAYFDVFAVMAERMLARLTGARRAAFARDYYSYLHLPMIAGIVLFALGLKKTLEHVDEPLDTVPAVALCGGLALYYFAHVALRIRTVATLRRLGDDTWWGFPSGTRRPPWVGPGRLGACIGMLVLVPVALEVDSLVALALCAVVSCGLVVWDVVHYREHRAQVREKR